MASLNRVSQINGELLKVLSGLLRQVKDPRVGGLATITRVDCTRDLSKCKVYISILQPEKRADALRGLVSASGFLRREAGAQLGLRHMPQLHFLPDDSIEEGTRILELLNKTRQGETE